MQEKKIDVINPGDIFTKNNQSFIVTDVVIADDTIISYQRMFGVDFAVAELPESVFRDTFQRHDIERN